MKTNSLLIALVLVGALLVSNCSSRPRVGALQSESRSVELGDAGSVQAAINFGAGNLRVTGGADKLLDADFTYNVDKLKPEVKYTGGTLVVQQPDAGGVPVLTGIDKFRNDWNLRLQNDVPMDLTVAVGGGISDLQLAGLSLTRLAVTQGAGKSTINLNGAWTHDLSATIDTGAADLSVQLPKAMGVRVNIDRGPSMIDAPGFRQDGSLYTNDAYGTSKVTLLVNIKAGIGLINLVLADSQ
jgi:hypothetical protein